VASRAVGEPIAEPTLTHAARRIFILGFRKRDEVAYLVSGASRYDLVGDRPASKRLGADRAAQKLPLSDCRAFAIKAAREPGGPDNLFNPGLLVESERKCIT
jgi:hypothetical protein